MNELKSKTLRLLWAQVSAPHPLECKQPLGRWSLPAKKVYVGKPVHVCINFLRWQQQSTTNQMA